LNTTQPLLSIGKFTSSSNTDAGVERFRVYADGRVYIGDQVPLSTGVHQNAMLSVDGKVIAKQFYVTTKPGVWGDDEFEKSLTLDSLKQEVEFALSNNHLRGIKPAKEVEEEGIEVNETMAVLVRKIERLYLYIYMLEEQNLQLKKELQQIKKSKN